jgi:hypothetical protein
MADSVVELITREVLTRVDAATAVPVYRSRDAALAENQLPSIIVVPVSDEPSEGNGSICWMNWTLVLAVDILVGEGKDTAGNLYRSAVYGAIMADRDLTGVPGVIDVTPGPVAYQFDGLGGSTAYVRCPFTIRYRTRHNDLTVAPI